MRRLAKWQEKHGEGSDFTGRRAFDEHPNRWETREETTRREMYERNTGNHSLQGLYGTSEASQAGSQARMIR